MSQIKKLIHQSNLIEGFDNPKFDAQGLVAWDHLLELGLKDLDHRDIQKIQKIVTLLQPEMQPLWRGYYRNASGVEVKVGGKSVLAAKHVNEFMDIWLRKWKRKHDPKAAHIDFEHIHPFVDGNGRTGRLLMWWMQYKHGDPLTEITFKDRASYYDWFNEPEISKS